MVTQEADAVQAFTATASTYDQERSKLIPGFDLLYGAALSLIADWRPASCLRVLDLGAGTGLFAAMVADGLPDARFVLLDASEAMLAQAAGRIASSVVFSLMVADMAHDPLEGEWDLVISSLAIHHLDDAAKRRLYQRIYDCLAPGGLFVNVEQVIAPTPATDQRYERMWRRGVAENGAPPDQIAAGVKRMAFDCCATLNEQLQWLADIGFVDVDCIAKAWRFAVFAGFRRR